MSKEIAEKLQKALELLGPNGENWGKEMEILEGNKECAVTACRKAGLNSAWRYLDPFTGATWVSSWNDAPERTFSEVREVFQKAIEANR